jgi:hypothetical protein
MGKEEVNNRNRYRYNKYKSMGLCTRCGGTIDGKFLMCSHCLEISRERSKKYELTTGFHERRKKYPYEYKRRPEIKERNRVYSLAMSKTANRKERVRNYVRNKRASDVNYKLKSILRRRLIHAIKNNAKTGSAIDSLGCTMAELKLYLESKFQPGMTWDNHGNRKNNWSIDHIIPLSAFDLTDPEQFNKACHYTNLQPMWHIENIKKGNRMPGEINICNT